MWLQLYQRIEPAIDQSDLRGYPYKVRVLDGLLWYLGQPTFDASREMKPEGNSTPEGLEPWSPDDCATEHESRQRHTDNTGWYKSLTKGNRWRNEDSSAGTKDEADLRKLFELDEKGLLGGGDYPTAEQLKAEDTEQESEVPKRRVDNT